MMKYSTPYEKGTARALGVSLPVSLKKSVEVCRFIRGKPLGKAIRLLELAKQKKVAVPFTRFNRGGTGHKPNIGPGRYPVAVCAELIKLLRQAEANAQGRGLNAQSMVIRNAIAKKGQTTPRYGRQRGRQAKRTHVEVVVAEAK